MVNRLALAAHFSVEKQAVFFIPVAIFLPWRMFQICLRAARALHVPSLSATEGDDEISCCYLQEEKKKKDDPLLQLST